MASVGPGNCGSSSTEAPSAVAPAVDDVAPEDGGFDRTNVLYLSGAHFIHDCYPAFLGVLLPVLIPRLGLSLAAAGVVASSIRWTTSLQPLLGYWADRTDTRYWVIVAPTTTAFCMSLLGLVPNVATLVVLLLLTGVSHAAFHPAGGALATRAAGAQWGKGTAYFMTGGEFGRVIGPLLIASIIGAVGVESSWIVFFLGLLASMLLYRRFRHATSLGIRKQPPLIRGVLREGRRPLLLMSAIIVLRSFMNVGLVIFYPTYATGTGSSLLLAGFALTVYELGGTAGAFAGGVLSDRHGRTRTMAFGLLLAAGPLVGAVLLGPTVSGLILLGIGGLALLSAAAVELVLMQSLMPDHRSSAVGITYFLKAIGAIVATIFIGALGDAIGLGNALLVGIAVGSLAFPVILMVPESGATTQGV